MKRMDEKSNEGGKSGGGTRVAPNSRSLYFAACVGAHGERARAAVRRSVAQQPLLRHAPMSMQRMRKWYACHGVCACAAREVLTQAP